MNMKLQIEKGKFLPPLVGRLMLATAFVSSGREKFADIEGTASFFKGLRIPWPKFMARFVAATEVGCGSLLALGAATRLAAIPLMPVMVAALSTARRKEFRSFTDLTGVYEFSYLILLSYLVTNGAGAISVDAIASKAVERRRAPRLIVPRPFDRAEEAVA